MPSIRWGVGMWQSATPRQLAALVELCEGLGYDQFWYGNHKLYRDMFMGLMLASQHSSRMKLGSFIAEPYTMHPALIAAAIATLHEASDGRAILGLGTGGANFKEIGVERARPLSAMREAIQIIRPLLSGETVNFRGKVFVAERSRLQFQAPPGIPIVLATRGNQMLELGGEIADAVMIATYATPEGVRHALAQVERGIRKAGRRKEDVDIICRVDACVWDDSRTARDAVKPMIAGFLMASYPDRGFVHQMGLEIPEELENVIRQKDEALAYGSWKLVPDEFVEAFTWAGTPDEVARQVAEIIKLGITQITFLPQPPDRTSESAELIMRSWMAQVVPRVEKLIGAYQE